MTRLLRVSLALLASGVALLVGGTVAAMALGPAVMGDLDVYPDGFGD